MFHLAHSRRSERTVRSTALVLVSDHGMNTTEGTFSKGYTWWIFSPVRPCRKSPPRRAIRFNSPEERHRHPARRAWKTPYNSLSLVPTVLTPMGMPNSTLAGPVIKELLPNGSLR